MKKILIPIIVLNFSFVFSAHAENLRTVDCRGGFSISHNAFLEAIDELEPGESNTEFKTMFFYGAGRPPESFPSPLYALVPGESRYERAASLVDHSLELVPEALLELERNPSLLDRYKNRCILDNSTDHEILSRGVEVMQWVAHFSDGSVITTDYFTSLSPDVVTNLDIEQINSFLNQVQSSPNFENFEYIEILHNHVLPDTLSLIDVEYAALVSFEMKNRVMITAIIKEGERIVETRSAIYTNGFRGGI